MDAEKPEDLSVQQTEETAGTAQPEEDTGQVSETEETASTPESGEEAGEAQPEGAEDAEERKGWSAERQAGYTQGTQKYAELVKSLREQNQLLADQLAELQEKMEELAAAKKPDDLPPLPEGVDHTKAVPAINALLPYSKVIQEVRERLAQVEADSAEAISTTTIASLGADPVLGKYMPAIQGELRHIVKATRQKDPAAIRVIAEALAFRHAANHADAAMRAHATSRKARGEALKTKGQTIAGAPQGRPKGGPGKSVLEMTTKELQNLSDKELLEALTRSGTVGQDLARKFGEQLSR